MSWLLKLTKKDGSFLVPSRISLLRADEYECLLRVNTGRRIPPASSNCFLRTVRDCRAPASALALLTRRSPGSFLEPDALSLLFAPFVGASPPEKSSIAANLWEAQRKLWGTKLARRAASVEKQVWECAVREARTTLGRGDTGAGGLGKATDSPVGGKTAADQWLLFLANWLVHWLLDVVREKSTLSNEERLSLQKRISELAGLVGGESWSAAASSSDGSTAVGSTPLVAGPHPSSLLLRELIAPFSGWDRLGKRRRLARSEVFNEVLRTVRSEYKVEQGAVDAEGIQTFVRTMVVCLRNFFRKEFLLGTASVLIKVVRETAVVHVPPLQCEEPSSRTDLTFGELS